MTTTHKFDLADLYRRAIVHTADAVDSLEAGDQARAYGHLEQRKSLVREIQRELGHSPAWGGDRLLDQAALDYLEADNALGRAIRRLE